MEKLKNAPKPVTIHLAEENFHSSRSTHQRTKRLEEENDYLNNQVSKLSKQIKDLRDELSLCATTERDLKKQVALRLDDIDTLKLEHQRKLNEE